MSVLTQGGESNFTGGMLESVVELHFKKRGIPGFDYGDDGDTRQLFDPTVYVRRVPYRSIYGCRSVSEFVLYHQERRIRIECRTQESSGSVDEKLPFLFWNARDTMPEQEIWVIIHGNGARVGAVEWLRRECAKVTTKSIVVMNLSGFYERLKDVLKG